MKLAIDALLVEDNSSDAQLFEALIGSSELAQPQLHHAERFEQALLALETNKFDVVLLDLCLPDGQGVDLVKQLRARIPEVPIVVVTGLQDSALAAAALKEGAQDYLVKSDAFSPARLAKLGHVDVGNLLVRTLQYAIERAELTRQLEVSEERYELAAQGANDGIWDWDLTTDRVYYSPRWRSLLGLAQTTMTDEPNEWLSRIHPADRENFDQLLQNHLERRQPQFCCEYRLLHSDGEYRWMLAKGVALWDDAGRAYRIAGSQTDMTERKSLEQALHQEKELAQITLHSIGDAVITTDEQGLIKDFNPVAERLTGWRAGDAKRQHISQVCKIIDGGTRAPLRNPAIQAMESEETISLSNHPTLLSRTGEEFAIGDSAAPIRSPNGEVVGTVLVFHDVTEERGRAQQLAWQASHDPLTHLFNRKKFIQSLDERIEESQSGTTQTVLCSMDLDHFKAVNDTCGHAAGDELLRQVADLWRSQIRKSDILARLGGDEFGLLLYGCDLSRATEISNDFCTSIQSFRFVYEGNVFSIGVSIGVVPITAAIPTTEEAMRLADNACYAAKNKGRNCVEVYHPNNDDIVQQSSYSQWFSRITEALDADQFCLYQQVITSMDTRPGSVTLCEILLRLPDAVSGQITPPMAFIPPAERYDLMPKIDRWVVKNFMKYLANCPQLPNLVYCVNLSGASINDEKFIDYVKQQLLTYPINPKHICFEITETVAISNLQKAAKFILELKQEGFAFALDDFGSGMSSFAYLKHLPVDYLKIDGNFVKESPTDSVMCAMVESINHIGHVMGLKTVAEYVESPAILSKVRELGMDYAQGFEMGYPQPLKVA